MTDIDKLRELDLQLDSEELGYDLDDAAQSIRQYVKIWTYILSESQIELGSRSDFLDGGVLWKDISEDDQCVWLADFRFLTQLPTIVNEGVPGVHRDLLDSIVVRWFLPRGLEYLRLRRDQGDTVATLDAVALCAGYSLIIPEWAARDLTDKVSRLRAYEFRTLNEAFGQFHPKNLDIKAAIRRDVLGSVTDRLVARRTETGQSKGVSMFEQIEDEIGVPAGTLSKAYYRQKDELHWFGREPL